MLLFKSLIQQTPLNSNFFLSNVELLEHIISNGTPLIIEVKEDNSMKKVWMFDPHTGGRKISPSVQELVRKRILAHAEKNYKGKYSRIEVKFKGPFCYIDAYQEPHVGKKHPTAAFGETREEFINRLRNTPTHLCRLRHFDLDRWSVAFYTYSHERYEPCVFPNGQWFGTPEQAFDIGAVYLE